LQNTTKSKEQPMTEPMVKFQEDATIDQVPHPKPKHASPLPPSLNYLSVRLVALFALLDVLEGLAHLRESFASGMHFINSHS
jgi:hypothetical protein